MGGKIEDESLLSWYWSVNSANNERFCYFRLEAHFFYLGYSVETLTKHLQLHLLYSSSSQLENGIGRAPRPSGLI